MRLFSITFIIAGLIAFAIANEQMNNCTDDGCADFYDGHTDSTPAPIVKIEPIKYTPVVDTTNGKDEFVITYNVDQTNLSSIPDNTILVHRKKESNTLYTINALNELIKKLNGGVVDTKFPIDWNHYRNCILLTQHNELNQLNTKIHKIVEV